MVTAVTSGRHRCPYEGCFRDVQTKYLACRAHWMRVSKVTRDAVYATFEAQDWAAHGVAVKDALAEMDAHYTKRQAQAAAAD